MRACLVAIILAACGGRTTLDSRSDSQPDATPDANVDAAPFTSDYKIVFSQYAGGGPIEVWRSKTAAMAEISTYDVIETPVFATYDGRFISTGKHPSEVAVITSEGTIQNIQEPPADSFFTLLGIQPMRRVSSWTNGTARRPASARLTRPARFLRWVRARSLDDT